MKIGVLIKRVPDTATQIKIKTDGTGIEEGDIKWVVSPYDEIAVEEALWLRERASGEVVIVTAGPSKAMETMRQALAMGVDRGICVCADNVSMDAYTTAFVLSTVCRDEGFDIIFAGKQSSDLNQGQVHIGVAEMLGWPHVSPVEKFEISADLAKVTLTRPVAGSLKDIVESALPVVIGCEKGLNEPRYPTLPGIMKARSKAIVQVMAKDLLDGVKSLLETLSYETPPERQGVAMIKGSPKEAADELVGLLRGEAKII